MDALLNAAIDHIWPKIGDMQTLTTPDDATGKNFHISSVGPNSVGITTEGGSSLMIQRIAFIEAIRYLVLNGHSKTNPCEIRSHQHAENSGPLCAATRAVNGNTRVINYIVPILVAVGILGCRGARPNTAWLA